MSSVSIYLLSQCGRQGEREREGEHTHSQFVSHTRVGTFHVPHFPIPHTHTQQANRRRRRKFIASFCGCGRQAGRADMQWQRQRRVSSAPLTCLPQPASLLPSPSPSHSAANCNLCICFCCSAEILVFLVRSFLVASGAANKFLMFRFRFILCMP